MIVRVEPFSTAEDQQILTDWVILEADRKKLNDVDDFSAIVESKKGSALLLNVMNKDGVTRFIGIEIPE